MKKVNEKIKKVLFVALSLMTTTVFVGATVSATENMGKQNPLNGLRVGFYGDSICAANSENRIGWAGRVGNANQMIWDNNGQGGWAVSDCSGSRKNLYYQLTTSGGNNGFEQKGFTNVYLAANRINNFQNILSQLRCEEKTVLNHHTV